MRHFDEDRPGPAGGVGGALYPEWNVTKNEYRPEWCRVLAFALGSAPEPFVIAAAYDQAMSVARQGVEGADTAVGDAASPCGDFIVDVAGSEHGSGATAEVGLVEAALDAALAVVQPPS